MEHFQAVGLDKGGVGVGVAEFFVAHHQGFLLLYGIDDDGKEFGACGDVFQNQLILDGESVHEHVVDGECSEHPALSGIVGQCLWVADVVLVGVRGVAFDADTKHVFDGQFQAVEGGSGERSAVVEVIVDPQLLDFFEADSAVAFDGVDQPDVLSEGVGDTHHVEVFRKDKKNS